MLGDVVGLFQLRVKVALDLAEVAIPNPELNRRFLNTLDKLVGGCLQPENFLGRGGNKNQPGEQFQLGYLFLAACEQFPNQWDGLRVQFPRTQGLASRGQDGEDGREVPPRGSSPLLVQMTPLSNALNL